VEGKSDYFSFFLLRTIALRYSIAYYLSYFPYWPSDYYLSETYVLASYSDNSKTVVQIYE